MPVGLTLLLLAGCGSSNKSVQEDRQFANNAPTGAAESPTATISVQPTTVPTSQRVTVDPNAPFGTRGAPATAYLLDANKVTIVDLSGASATLHQSALEVSPGELLRDVSPSPSGEHAAVLISDTVWSPGSLRVAVLDRQGALIAGPLVLDALSGTPAAAASPEATPAASPAVPGDGTGISLSGRPSRLSWSPDGESIVVTEAGSTVVILQVHGETLSRGESIAVEPSVGRLVGAWMSPRGDRVMVLLVDAQGSQSIATISLTGDDRRPHVVWPGTDERHAHSVRAVAWLPDGSGMFFTRADRDGNAGNLYQVSLSDLVPRVVATAGRAGPSGRIGSFVVSPDGKSVAYTLETPSGDGHAWDFHSLWVRNLQAGTAIEVPTGNTTWTSSPIWTRSGLIWEEHRDLVVARSGADSEVIATRTRDGDRWKGTSVAATPASATPEASPVASPQATPAASPFS